MLPQYIKCSACGCVHFVVSEESASAQVALANEHLHSIGEPENATFESYLHCFRCGADGSGFVPAQKGDVPLLADIPPVVVQR